MPLHAPGETLTEMGHDEAAILELLTLYASLADSQIATQLCVRLPAVQETLQELADDGLVRKWGGGWLVTDAGRSALYGSQQI